MAARIRRSVWSLPEGDPAFVWYRWAAAELYRRAPRKSRMVVPQALAALGIVWRSPTTGGQESVSP